MWEESEYKMIIDNNCSFCCWVDERGDCLEIGVGRSVGENLEKCNTKSMSFSESSTINSKFAL